MTVMPSSLLAMRNLKSHFLNFIVLCLSYLCINSAYALGAEGLLRPEQAFTVTAQALSSSTLELRWQISPGYYLYRDKIQVSSLAPEIELGALNLPAAQPKHDPNFGEMLIYREQVTVTLPIKQNSHLSSFKIKVTHQGCADVGVCYPPQKAILDIALPAQTNAASDLLQQLVHSSLPQDSLLPAEQAFQFSAFVKDAQTLHVNWLIADGYYLYREKTTLSLETSENAVKLGSYQIPHGQARHDEAFGDVEIFFHTLEFDVPLDRSNNAMQEVMLHAGFQGCAERGVCYPPIKQSIALTLPAATSLAVSEHTPRSDQDQIISALKTDSFALTLISFFGFGVLLAFTPCIFPMIPILSGIIVGKGREVTTKTAFLLSLSYVVAGAVTYTGFGILAALFGSNLQATFQQPWIIGLFSGIFVILALSMFGFYHLELPKFLQAKLHNSSEKFRNGSYWGAAIMGSLASLIVGPCVAAPLAGALIYIGQTGDALLGGAALFMMGLGMGVPLLILGASAGKLLPKAGHWLNATKAVFGVIMLAVAVWMLDRILPAAITMLLWACLLIVPAMYLRALDPLPDHASNWSRFFKGIGVIMLIYGVVLLLGVSMGNSNPLSPLQNASANANTNNKPGLQFQPVQSSAELDHLLAQASAEQKPVMLDFYADWCISCKEMEAYTYTDPQVQERLSGFVLLKADVTQNSAADQALLQRFQLIGPPATLFFDKQQHEITSSRVIGFLNSTQFLAAIPDLR